MLFKTSICILCGALQQAHTSGRIHVDQVKVSRPVHRRAHDRQGRAESTRPRRGVRGQLSERLRSLHSHRALVRDGRRGHGELCQVWLPRQHRVPHQALLWRQEASNPGDYFRARQEADLHAGRRLEWHHVCEKRNQKGSSLIFSPIYQKFSEVN